MSGITWALVDPRVLLRRGIRVQVDAARGISSVGDVATVAELATLLEAGRPDVIVAANSVEGGWQAVLETAGDVPVVLLVSPGRDARNVEAAIRGGVLGAADEQDTVSALLSVIAAATDGERSVAPTLARAVADSVRASRAATGRELSRREREVLAGLARGLRNREIAGELGCASETVKSHVASILRKLELPTRAAAAAWAVREGDGAASGAGAVR